MTENTITNIISSEAQAELERLPEGDAKDSYGSRLRMYALAFLTQDIEWTNLSPGDVGQMLEEEGMYALAQAVKAMPGNPPPFFNRIVALGGGFQEE